MLSKMLNTLKNKEIYFTVWKVIFYIEVKLTADLLEIKILNDMKCYGNAEKRNVDVL